MPGPGLITGYLETLSGQLPWPVVEELADGLEETYRRHLGLGLAPDAAAAVAVAEFGAPELIAAEFARAHPARRAARRLLVTGPVVGSCWAVALITSRAWTWPVPDGGRPRARPGAGGGRGAAGVRGAQYPVPAVGRAGAAGCVGTAALDAFMIIGVLAAGPAARWAVAVAITASAARLALNVRLVRPVLAGNGLHDRAAALDQDDIAPAPMMLADAFPCPDDAKPGGQVQGHAGRVLREDAGLDGPDPGRLGRGDQGLQQPGGRCPGRGRRGGRRRNARRHRRRRSGRRWPKRPPTRRPGLPRSRRTGGRAAGPR